MEHFAGLDVSVKETSVCIVDDTGRIVREVKVASEPDALLSVLTNPTYHFKRIGLEAGPLSQWLFSVLAEAGLPAICVETRHMQAVLKSQINKTDRNDARGIAQIEQPAAAHPYPIQDACASHCNTPNTRSGSAADAVRQRSERDPNSRAVASRSDVQRTGSATATSGRSGGHESPSFSLDS